MKLTAHLHFVKGYIAHPYWPEREKLINIQKESGTKRARSEEKRLKALRDYLAAHGMTQEDYEALERKADRQFYCVSDLNGIALPGHQPEEIVIPAHHWYGALAAASDLASASIRIAKPEQIRTVLQVGDAYTGKTARDGVFSRFVTVTAGTGAKLSNQRALRENDFIANFDTDLPLTFSEDILNPDKVRRFVEFLGRDIGVGASRKLGWGRFEVKWEAVS